jgi:hypothetical protein
MLPPFRNGVLQESNILHDHSPELEIPTAVASLGVRFTTAPWHEELHPAMTSLLEIFRRLIQHLEISMLFPTRVPPADNDLFVVIQHQMLSVQYKNSDNNNDRSSHMNLNEPLRLSLLLYLYIRIVRFGNLPMVGHIVEHLKASLTPDTDAGLSYFQSAAPDLLFWILYMGGMASQGYSSHGWFVGRLADVAKNLGMEEWDGHVRPLLGEFFYTDQVGDTAGEDLWSEVVVLRGEYRYIAPKASS